MLLLLLPSSYDYILSSSSSSLYYQPVWAVGPHRPPETEWARRCECGGGGTVALFFIIFIVR